MTSMIHADTLNFLNQCQNKSDQLIDLTTIAYNFRIKISFYALEELQKVSLLFASIGTIAFSLTFSPFLLSTALVSAAVFFTIPYILNTKPTHKLMARINQLVDELSKARPTSGGNRILSIVSKLEQNAAADKKIYEIIFGNSFKLLMINSKIIGHFYTIVNLNQKINEASSETYAINRKTTLEHARAIKHELIKIDHPAQLYHPLLLKTLGLLNEETNMCVLFSWLEEGALRRNAPKEDQAVDFQKIPKIDVSYAKCIDEIPLAFQATGMFDY